MILRPPSQIPNQQRRDAAEKRAAEPGPTLAEFDRIWNEESLPLDEVLKMLRANQQQQADAARRERKGHKS